MEQGPSTTPDDAEQVRHARRVAGVVMYTDKKLEAQRKCMEYHMELLQCMKGNHLFSFRSCAEQDNKYWDCMERVLTPPNQVTPIDAAKRLWQGFLARVEEKKADFAEIYKELTDQK